MKKTLSLLFLIYFSIAASSQNIVTAEYFFDSDPGIGNGTQINVGAPGDIVNFNASISVASLGAGFHFLAIRAKDANGVWGLLERRGFYISTSTANAADITAAEYFFDNDPGVGNGLIITISSPGSTVNFTTPIPEALSPGFHFLAIRTKGSDGKWGLFERRGFYISSSTTDVADITAAEYFFDSDPGIGNAIAIAVGTPGSTVSFSAVIPESLSAGFHFLAIRTKGSDGKWGLFERRGFYISSSTTDAADITAAEYFFDSDPGVGNGNVLSVGTAGSVVNFMPAIPTSLSPGFHFLAIRTKGSDGKWGLFERRGFYISNTTSDAGDIVAAEYFFDADPGVGNGMPLTITTPGSIVNQVFMITEPGLSLGTHYLTIRVKDADGKWGIYDFDTLAIGVSTITCPANASASTAVGECSAVVNSIDPTIDPPQSYTYTLSGATTGSGSGSASGLSFNAGTTTVTYALAGSPSVNCSFTVSVTPVAPTVSIQPVTQSVCAGTNVTFTVSAVGSGLIYQWRKNGVNISGANNNSFTINNAAAGDAGSYDVVISTTCGTNVISNAASLTVNIPPLITTQPTNKSVCAGDDVTFTVIATGSGLSYQWRKGGVNISGATGSSYTISGAVVADAGSYDVVVSGICPPTATSNTVTLTVNTPPVITAQPTNQTVCSGANVTFNVTATGSGLTYQWRKAGVDISGATSASFTITGTTIGDGGNYDVIVSGICPPTATSNSVSLTVNTPPVIGIHPSSQAVCPGDNVTFNVTATGTGLTYQWRKGGVDISGATSASYTIMGVSAGDAGNYDVVVSGTCAPPATSNIAVLTVNAVTAITSQPSGQTKCVGEDVTFTVAATGTGTLTYQWRKDGVNISGATSASYTITGVVAADAADYDVIVTGICGTATSNTATLTVNPLTAITLQPANQSSCEGGSVSFSVTAIGSGLSYQWKKDGTDISGATSSTYTINPVSSVDVAAYTVQVTGSCGTVLSNPAALTIVAGTVINTQPVSQSACLGGMVTFTVSASGSGTITYQWKKNGVDITGATSSSFTINPVTGGDAADYTVVASSLCGTTTSNVATLSILPATSITTQPTNQTVCSGSNATFSVIAAGDNLSYQWRKDGIDISGATSASLTVTGVGAADLGNYDVVVTGTCGTVTSGSASLSLGNVVIITHPASQSACTSTSVTFSVTATGSGISYQWRKDGSDIAGATASPYTISSVVTGDAGNYDVVVTGTCGTVTSNAATLTVNTVPVIGIQPASQTVCAGSDITFTVAATGTGLMYQWRKGGVNISGATSSSYTINAVVTADAGNYDVVVSGTCTPSATSGVAVLTVNTAPAITTQPASQSSFVGANVTFTVVATGAGLTYQWRKGGVTIPGATNSSYTITGLVLSDAGDYDVVISGTCPPTATSATATLTVSAVMIVTQPTNQSVCVGSNVTFNVVANGTGLTYQWQVSSGGPFANIGGATTSSLTLNAVTIGMNGNQYRCVIGGSLNSAAATLTVNALPNVTLDLPVDSLYKNTPIFILTGGSPAGGTYSGTGINSGVFIPGSNNLGNYQVTYTYTNANGCTSSATDVFTVLPKADLVNIYPNPVDDGNITILVAQALVGSNATVYDSKGQKVKSWKIPGRLSSYKFKWATGTYTIVFTGVSVKVAKQFVIVR